MADNVFLGEDMQSFHVSPAFDAFDLVILNIDENTYVSSPFVSINEETWESSAARRHNGDYVYTYDVANSRWIQSSGPTTVTSGAIDLAAIGITAQFNVQDAAQKSGDKIVVTRIYDADSEKLSLDIELKRSGRTLEVDCPLVKESQRQAIADRLLTSICKHQYQPFEAKGAYIHPLAELGDGITAHGMFSSMIQQEIEFDPYFASDIKAPGEEETESEYGYTPATERNFSRKVAKTQAQLDIHADQIAAKVSKEGGEASSFAWELLDSYFRLLSGNTEVFRVDSDGAKVTGRITATSGYIGSTTRGFEISASSIANGMTSFNDTEHDGVYVGTDGIALGKGKFRVTPQGALYASSGTFGGTVRANQIITGGDNGYITGSQIGSGAVTADKIGSGAITSGKIGSGAVTSDKIDSGAITEDKIADGAIRPAALGSAVQRQIKDWVIEQMAE